MSEKQIRVSVLCLAYNHEKYIRRALEAFVSQKTAFHFEVLIHDDASTDGTANIIREYAEKYPDLIRPVFQKENQYSQKIPIFKTHVNHLIRGDYVALCEGDDYWTDCEKLQKQFDVMERHPECSICVHRIQEVKEDGVPNGFFRPRVAMEEQMLDTQQFLNIREKYPFQTGCYFMRTKYWVEMYEHPAEFRKPAKVGDEPMLLYMAAFGKMYYLPECMSAYRMFSIGSWSASHKFGRERQLERARWTCEMMRLYDAYTGHRYNCRLEYYEAHVLWLSEEYRKLAGKKYRGYVKKMRFSRRMFVYVCAVLPFVGKLRKLAKEKR